MPSRTRFGHPASQALHLVAASVSITLLYSCAAPMYHRSGGLFSPAPTMPPPVLDIVQVHELRGSATVQSGTQRIPLKVETEIHENQPVQVGSRSTMRLALGQRALIDMGPNSRFVIHKLPRDGKGEERATWMRLEQGYMRVVWSDDAGDTPMEVSFGRWAARIGAGEHFFDTRGETASACSTSGAMRLAGVPEWTPRSLSEPCVTLEPHRAPVEVALREKDWDTLRTKRKLQPTLARAAEQQASRALARADKDGIRTVSWKPATAPGAFSADQLAPGPAPQVSAFSRHTPPVIQIPAQTPVEIPVVVQAPPEPAPTITPEDVPTVAVTETETVTTTTGYGAPVIVVPTEQPAPAPETTTVAMATAPGLKWTESLETDTSNLQPVAPAAAEVASIEEPSAAPVAVAPAPVVEMPGSNAADSSGAEWIVNVATYAAPELAQQHAQQLIAQNFKATVRHETVRGRSSYRVVIEGLTSETAANSAVADLGTKWGVRSAWAMRKR